jgi:hypothetical protein
MSHGSYFLLLLYPLKTTKRLDINTKVTPNEVRHPFRDLFCHLVDLISQTEKGHRMPIGGIPLLIYLLSP